MSRAALLAAAVCLATLAAACGGTECGGHARDEAASAPVVNAFWLLGSQIPGDPWTLLFGVDYRDDDGDLEGGQAEFFLNDNAEATTQSLDEVFRQSGAAPDDTAASLWMALRFADTLNDDASVRLGLQLVDGAGQRSNCFTLTLQFDVTPVALARPGAAPRLLAARRVRCGGSS